MNSPKNKRARRRVRDEMLSENPCFVAVENDPYHFFCNTCQSTLATESMKNHLVSKDYFLCLHSHIKYFDLTMYFDSIFEYSR